MPNIGKNSDQRGKIQNKQNPRGFQPIVDIVNVVESVKTEIGKEIDKSEIKRAEFESLWEYTLKKSDR